MKVRIQADDRKRLGYKAKVGIQPRGGYSLNC